MSKGFMMQFDGVELHAYHKGRVLLLRMRDSGLGGDWYELEGFAIRASVVHLRDFLNEWIGEDDE